MAWRAGENAGRRGRGAVFNVDPTSVLSPWRAFAASAAEGWKLNPVEGFLTMKGQPIPRNADRPVLWQRC
jgi:hypothetical protein